MELLIKISTMELVQSRVEIGEVIADDVVVVNDEDVYEYRFTNRRGEEISCFDNYQDMIVAYRDLKKNVTVRVLADI